MRHVPACGTLPYSNRVIARERAEIDATITYYIMIISAIAEE